MIFIGKTIENRRRLYNKEVKDDFKVQRSKKD